MCDVPSMAVFCKESIELLLLLLLLLLLAEIPGVARDSR
jgi:hypothetical protein